MFSYTKISHPFERKPREAYKVCVVGKPALPRSFSAPEGRRSVHVNSGNGRTIRTSSQLRASRLQSILTQIQRDTCTQTDMISWRSEKVSERSPTGLANVQTARFTSVWRIL